MYKIYGDIRSGNCYKIKLLLSLLDIEHEWIHVDVTAQQTRSAISWQKIPMRRFP